MTINLAGAAIKDVRVAGAQAQRVMLGTGSAAVEVWSASPYPLSGEWSATPVGRTVMASHTIVESGTFTLTHTVTGHGVPFEWSGIRGPWGTTAGTAADPSIATVTRTLTAGTVIEFMAGSSLTTFSVNGSWSIVKN